MAPGGPYGMNFSGADGSFPAPFGDGYGVHRVCFMPEILLNFCLLDCCIGLYYMALTVPL